jgi:hypothetical protein
MTYTDQMARAFHSIPPPQNFSVQIVDHEHFLAVRADEKQFMRLLDREKREAIEYMVRVKKVLEDNGAIVLLVREAAQ